MQAWTPVLVIDPDHPRTGTAGICQGVPMTPQAATEGRAAELAAAADQAEAQAADAASIAADTAAASKAAKAAATAARKAADKAAAEAAGEPVDTAPRVMVRFDADQAVECVPVAQLQALG